MLQRIEEFKGLVILSTNLKANLDDAFSRRFQSIIHFPIPGPPNRARLWKAAFPATLQLEAGIELPEMAEAYELSGGSIINVARYASLQGLKNQTNVVLKKDLLRGIELELAKNGKVSPKIGFKI